MSPSRTSSAHPPQLQPSPMMSPSYLRRRPQMQQPGTTSLHLPSLPRFHPANFPSQGSSAPGTPGSGGTSPQAPTSPRSTQRQYSEAQRQLYLYQRELIASAARATLVPPGTKPESPRLDPLGSPGPVTPLELEQNGADYLAVGAAKNRKKEELEKLVREEAKRYDMSSKRTASISGR